MSAAGKNLVIARALVALTGNDERRYVPGTAYLTPGVLTWDEKCRARCTHTGDHCHVSRSAAVPSGPIDWTAS